MPARPPLPPPGRARELALKELRRADALRANLRRRKDQERAREEEVEVVASPERVLVAQAEAQEP